jgi:hypothetical protein
MEDKEMETLPRLLVDITLGLGLMALGLGVFVLGPTCAPGGGVLQPACGPVVLVESDVREGVGGIPLMHPAHCPMAEAGYVTKTNDSGRRLYHDI